jgi:hypothetical protein
VNDDGIALHHPDDVGTNDRMANFVDEEEKAGGRDNTALAYDGKILEFKQFCNAVYPREDFRQVVTHEKMYRFFFYTAFREQKKKGGRKGENGNALVKFDHEEYIAIFKSFGRADGNPKYEFPRPTKPLSATSFAQYKAVIKSLHCQQQAQGVNQHAWEFIWTERCKRLEKHVKTRMPAIKKANFVEKHNGAFAPYRMVARFGEIEEELWNDLSTANNKRCLSSRLRHRSCALYLTSGVLRSESLYKADCSDFFILKPPMKSGDIHEKTLLINQIPEGKTTHGKTQYGRATRHKDVRRCAMGAMSFYMMHRIDVTGEFSSMSVSEWMDNSEWFNIKFLVDINTLDNQKELKSDTYGKHVKSVLQRLRLRRNLMYASLQSSI